MWSRQLTNDLLTKGFNFSITSKTLPNKDIIASSEDAVKDLQQEEVDTIRAKTSLTLQNSKPPKDNLLKDKRKTLKELQSDASIVILPADKGRSTVILNREDYLEKCMDHINNGPYQLLKKDPTTKIKAKTLKQLKVLKDNEFIELYYYLKPTDSPAPRFYGQPKIHKPGVPIRPIVSYSGSTLCNLNKDIANILKAYVKHEDNNAKNSVTFSNYIENVSIEDGEIMISFGVTSLYTNIPVIHTLNIIKDYVTNDGNLSGILLYLKKSFLIQLILFQQPLGTLLILSFANKQMALQSEDQHLQRQLKFICRIMNIRQYLRHYTVQKFGNDLRMMFIPFLNVSTLKTLYIISIIFIKLLSLLWRKKALENQRFLTLY